MRKGIGSILLRVLAKRNAAFSPVRTASFGQAGHNRNANAHIARRRYAEHGLEWASGGRADKERQQIHRDLEEAEAAGLVIRIGGQRTTGVKLTVAGEFWAASKSEQFLCGDIEPIELMQAMIRRKMKAQGLMYTPEDDLLNLPGIRAWKLERRPALARVEEALLPFIVRGFIGVGSTVRGNARYWIKKMPADGDFGPPCEELFSGAARDEYYEAFEEEIEALEYSPVGERGEIGPIPLVQSAVGYVELADWKMSAELAAQGL